MSAGRDTSTSRSPVRLGGDAGVSAAFHPSLPNCAASLGNWEEAGESSCTHTTRAWRNVCKRKCRSPASGRVGARPYSARSPTDVTIRTTTSHNEARPCRCCCCCHGERTQAREKQGNRAVGAWEAKGRAKGADVSTATTAAGYGMARLARVWSMVSSGCLPWARRESVAATRPDQRQRSQITRERRSPARDGTAVALPIPARLQSNGARARSRTYQVCGGLGGASRDEALPAGGLASRAFRPRCEGGTLGRGPRRRMVASEATTSSGGPQHG